MWRTSVILERSMYREVVLLAGGKKESPVRHFRGSAIYLVDVQPLKPSSKVELSVSSFKSDIQKPVVTIQEKSSLVKRVKDELIHYYHGFRLLFINVGISWNLGVKLLQGEHLSRREKKQLIRTTSDLFRLVPFSVFIIVPFMELTLPLFLKVFPNMLPSTFQTAHEHDAKLKAKLKVKLEMAKFLQQTLDEMAVKRDGRQSQTAREFAEFFAKVRSSGRQPASTEEILRFSKLFEDEITLDSLSRAQLLAICRVLEIPPIGTNNLLRFQLRMKLRHLAADDKLIQKEGIDSLSVSELQAACRARGMRSLGVSEIRLKSQLLQWLDLSLDEKVPPSLLLLSRALYLPDSDSTTEQLQATIASLPESFATRTRDAISQRRGKMDYKARIEALRLEQANIIQERSENIEKPNVNEYLTMSEAIVLEKALLSIAIQRNKQLLLEKEDLSDLKEELAEYQAAVNELHQLLVQKPLVIRESKAAKRLFNRISRMITNLDGSVSRLEFSNSNKIVDKTETDYVQIEELITSIQQIQQRDDSSQLQQIMFILHKIDQDQDGIIRVDDVLKIIQLLEEEESRMSLTHMTDMLDLVKKEQALDMEEKIAKSLQTKIRIVDGNCLESGNFVQNATKTKEGNQNSIFVNGKFEKPSDCKKQIDMPSEQKSLKTGDAKLEYLFTAGSDTHGISVKVHPSIIKPLILDKGTHQMRSSESQSASL